VNNINFEDRIIVKRNAKCIASLVRKGYLPLNKKFVTYDYYFIRENKYK
jgi:hypothetical protein